jgi:topoisomerase IA-like protein
MENPPSSSDKKKALCIGLIDNQKAWLNLNGPYGAFIRHDMLNYSVPSFYDVNKLTLNDVEKIINYRKAYLANQKQVIIN